MPVLVIILGSFLAGSLTAPIRSKATCAFANSRGGAQMCRGVSLAYEVPPLLSPRKSMPDFQGGVNGCSSQGRACFCSVSHDSTIPTDQDRSVEEWEKKTFEKQPPEKVMDAAGIKPGMVVGEVGAGRGRFTVHLARRVGSSGKILANDIDIESLDYLRERCRLAGIDNVETILGKVDDPLFPEGALDLAFMVWTYHFMDQPVAVLKNLRPALKPGGTVVLVEPDPVRGPGMSDHGISPERMRREAAQAGFELVRTETFLPEDLLFVLRTK